MEERFRNLFDMKTPQLGNQIEIVSSIMYFRFMSYQCTEEVKFQGLFKARKKSSFGLCKYHDLCTTGKQS